MIIRKTETDPDSRNGFQCVGKVTSAGTGILTITVEGKDYSSKITGITLTPLVDSATTLCHTQLTSITYAAATGLTTILARVWLSDDATTPAFTLTDSIVVYYSFWVDNNTLPTTLSTNDTGKGF